jgi:hypothetical protein
MSEATKPAGYVIVHQDWYEKPDEENPLLRNARISTLNPDFFVTWADARLVKHCFEVLEVMEGTPVEFTIGECSPVGQAHYETLEDAQNYLRELGIKNPHMGFNPIDWS